MNRLIKNFKYIIFKFRFRNHRELHWEGKNIIRADCEISKDSAVFIPKDVYFRKGCAVRVRDHARLEIGHNVSFSDNCILTCRESISIGNNVMFGPNTIIFDNDHDFRSEDYKINYKTSPIIIEDDVWIGANVCILRGSHIKKGAVIGAGTVVTGIIENHTVCYSERQYITHQY